MGKNRFLKSFWLHTALKLLAWEIVLIILALLLYNFTRLRQYYFSDILFLISVLELLTGSYAMVRSPDRGWASPLGVPAYPVQDTEEEKRYQLVERVMRTKSVALRLVASGVLTLLIAVCVQYLPELW